MEKIKCSEKISNEQVLDRIGEKRTLLNNILRRKANECECGIEPPGSISHGVS